MDISNFFTWFIQQLVGLFTNVFSTLDSITFAGTSLLKVFLFINVIIPFIYIVITVPVSINKNKGEKK